MSTELEHNAVEDRIEKPALTAVELEPVTRRPPLDRRDSVWGRVRFFEALTSLAVVPDDDGDSPDADADGACDSQRSSSSSTSTTSTSAAPDGPNGVGISDGDKQVARPREHSASRCGDISHGGGRIGNGRLVVLPSEKNAAQRQQEFAAAVGGALSRPRSQSTQLSGTPTLPLSSISPTSDPTARSTRFSMPPGPVCTYNTVYT